MKELRIIKASEERLFGYRDTKNVFVWYDHVKALPFIPILVNDKYYQYYTTESTYNLWFGSSGSAKSYEMAMLLLYMAHTRPVFRLLYVRKHEADIRKSQFQLFKDIIKDKGLEEHFRYRETDMSIISLRTGNLLLAAGIDNPDKLKSINDITDVWIEEPINSGKKAGSNVERKDFGELDRRLRTAKADLHMWMTFNPVNKINWIYEDFFDEQSRRYHGSDVSILNTTYKDNAFVSEKILKTLSAQRGSDYTVYTLGLWGSVKTGQEWIYEFDAARDTMKVKYLPGIPIRATFDFNVIPYMSALLCQIREVVNPDTNRTEVEVRVFKEYALKNPHNTSRAVCQFMERDYLRENFRHGFYYYGDASGENRVPGISDESGGSAKAFNEIRKHLRRYIHATSHQVIRRNPARISARNCLNDILAGEKWNIRLMIDESCKQLIQDLEGMKDGIDGFLVEKKTDETGARYELYGHHYSALIYLLAKVFPNLMK